MLGLAGVHVLRRTVPLGLLAVGGQLLDPALGLDLSEKRAPTPTRWRGPFRSRVQAVGGETTAGVWLVAVRMSTAKPRFAALPASRCPYPRGERPRHSPPDATVDNNDRIQLSAGKVSIVSTRSGGGAVEN